MGFDDPVFRNWGSDDPHAVSGNLMFRMPQVGIQADLLLGNARGLQCIHQDVPGKFPDIHPHNICELLQLSLLGKSKGVLLLSISPVPFSPSTSSCEWSAPLKLQKVPALVHLSQQSSSLSAPGVLLPELSKESSNPL